MRGFDKLEEGRSRVLVYQVGSNRLYIIDYILGCYQMAVLGGLLDGSLLDPSGCQQSLLDPCVSQVDPCISQVDPCISQWILGGSSWILVGSMCIQLDPCISQQSLYRPQYIHYQILVDPCRSLVYPLVSLYTHSIPINPLYPYQSTLIHSYPPYPSILYLLISILCNRSILPSSSRHY